ncbi:MAG: hypothetical protein EBR82_79885 [Caulobacteraceae bacterium]|nr:hypothetical protein [Caulobacteraceae bacterium]
MATQEERDQIRLEKRHYSDLRWAVEHSILKDSDWTDLLALHAEYGKEGPLRLERELLPFWQQCQKMNLALDRAKRHPLTVNAADVLAEFSTVSTTTK